MNSLKYRISCENRLLQLLKDKDPNITVMLTARAADGFWQTNNEQYLDTVNNFNYTDITQLKTPEWHIDDWKHDSNSPLGVI
jgi:hypothetical protein